MEYFLIAGIVLAVLLPTWAYVTAVNSDTNYQLSMAYAYNAAQKIASIADMVRSQGEPASIKTAIYVPANVESITLTDREISFRIATSSGSTDVYATTKANLTGSLPIVQGSYDVRITAGQNNVSVQRV